MLGQTNDQLPPPPPPSSSDPFFDDDDDDTSSPAPPIISSIRIVTSKPPVYRQQNQSQSSSSPSPSSCCSERDVTDVSSFNGDQHPFHLRSMRHVLLGPSAPASRPPSPAQQQISPKKHVRIVADEHDKIHHHHQPYIHGGSRDYHRIRLTSSALNRQKQQQRIERENMRILERLRHTRATRSLKREELLTHYDQQMGYATYPLPSAPPPPPPPSRPRLPSRPSSAAVMSSSFLTSDKKHSNQSRPSSASHLSNSVRPRPVSAPTSTHGSSRSSSSRRPTWNDRWQQQE